MWHKLGAQIGLAAIFDYACAIFYATRINTYTYYRKIYVYTLASAYEQHLYIQLPGLVKTHQTV